MTLEPNIAARPYQYKHGDRPLDGYTIQRGAGRGGFGEVYYAVSDSGREVALKLVHTYEQVELRGISQCMNLKGPHLVTIFDVRYGVDGRPWVVMEFVSGPSLRELLDAAPSGLGPAKAAFFLREIAKGLSYLHECGIVHRDLKPGNIFYENGYVKIGDYGLSKTMSMTRHSGQTVAVGTLHYMAPEIGEGRYDQSIDIYALGALLYEMLTGQVPFFGSSPAEVLMKHLTADVNLSNVPEPFKSVVAKAMAKNPADRYQSAQEMVDAVFGSEQVRESVSQVSAASLTMIAGRVAGNIGGGAAYTPPPNPGPTPPRDNWEAMAARVGERLADASERIHRAGDQIAQRIGGPVAGGGPPLRDPFTLPARMFLGLVAAGLAGFAAMSIGGYRGDLVPAIFFYTMLSVIGAWLGAGIAWRVMGRSLAGESKWVAQLALGAPAGIGALILSLPAWTAYSELGEAMTATFFSLLLMQWDFRIAPQRKQRFSIGDLFTCGILAVILANVLDARWQSPVVFSVVGASLAVSLWARWGGGVAGQRAMPMAPPMPGAPQAAPVQPGVATPAAGPSSPPTPNTPGGNPADSHRGGQRGKWRKTRFQTEMPGFWLSYGVVFVLFLLVMANHHSTARGIAFTPFIFLPIALVPLIVKRIRLRTQVAMDSAMPQQVTLGGIFSGINRFLLSFIGGVILVLSMLLALGVSANVPAMIQHAGNPDLTEPMRHAFDSTDWPTLLLEDAAVASVLLAIISLIPLLLARRAGGFCHMLRGLIGVILLLTAIHAFGGALPSPLSMNFHLSPNAIVNHYFEAVRLKEAFSSSMIAVSAYIVLLWPVRRMRVVDLPPAPPPTPVAQ